MGVSEELCADPAIAVLRKNKKAEDQKTMTKSNNGLRKYVPATPPPPSRDSVSYTHLDVYKRQGREFHLNGKVFSGREVALCCSRRV